MWTKQVSPETIDNEIELQTIASKYNICPKILSVTESSITMEKVNGHTLFELYEDDPENVPLWIWDEIRKIVLTLYEEEGIEYIDISPFNFMKLNDKIIVIDFGDAKYVGDEPDWFLLEFLDGTNMWNPDFK